MQPTVRVLLIDDNAIEARLIAANLADVDGHHFGIERIGRLSEALERIPAGGYDAIVLDLTLPDSQGEATLTSVLAASPVAPVLVYSGLDDIELATKLVRAGASDYLVKSDWSESRLGWAIAIAIARSSSD